MGARCFRARSVLSEFKTGFGQSDSPFSREAQSVDEFPTKVASVEQVESKPIRYHVIQISLKDGAEEVSTNSEVQVSLDLTNQPQMREFIDVAPMTGTST
jgi:hypothetical protein